MLKKIKENSIIQFWVKIFEKLDTDNQMSSNCDQYGPLYFPFQYEYFFHPNKP